jgi:hypothetical protein
MIQDSLKPDWDMGIIFLKTPEPIIIPATSKIPVGSPKARNKGILDSSVVDFGIGVYTIFVI